jgi:hypothetical protein
MFRDAIRRGMKSVPIRGSVGSRYTSRVFHFSQPILEMYRTRRYRHTVLTSLRADYTYAQASVLLTFEW